MRLESTMLFIKNGIKLLCSVLLVGCVSNYNYRPVTGYVPDANTAKIVAEAVWKAHYGNDQINNQKPFQVYLVGRTWRVCGSLPSSGPGYVYLGGVAEIEIDKYSGKILVMSHGE